MVFEIEWKESVKLSLCLGGGDLALFDKLVVLNSVLYGLSFWKADFLDEIGSVLAVWEYE